MKRNAYLRLDGTKALVALLALTVIAIHVPPSARAQTCESSPTRHSLQVHGEVSGEREFSATVADRWTFRLQRIQHGWAIRLNDATGIDLTSITPPFRYGVNHRDIEGWHFRNADNTASNDGSVNAPQRDRVFVFSPALEGTGGYRPPDDATAIEFDGSEGRGSLRIHDVGLADLESDQKARLVYLDFSACLTWLKTDQEIASEAEYNSLAYADEESELILACGLDSGYELSAWMKPRYLGADFDGDGAMDHAVQVSRIADGQKGIAICRSGTWMDVFGMDDAMAEDLPANGFGGLEEWRVSAKNALREETLTNTGQVEREAEGDVLILERIEKSQHVIYWHGRAMSSGSGFVQRTLGRLVE
jgi:hypothetical protein